MDTTQILRSLRNERDRIDQAIAALQALNGTSPSAISGKASAPVPVKRYMSAAGRRRIAKAARRRWAAVKAGQRPSEGSAAKGSSPRSGRKPMSAAVRKRLSELAKKRWADRKKGAANL